MQPIVQRNLSEIRISAWNIDGIWRRWNSFRYSKLNDPYVQKQLIKFKIFGLLETHHTAAEEGNLHIQNFKCFSLCRPKSKNVKRHKASGGIAVYVHDSIKQGVRKIPIPGTECIILKLCQSFFGLQTDVFVCFAYCVPSNSAVLSREFMPSDIYNDLREKLAQLTQLGSIVLLGDMNARTKTLPDFINNESNEHIPLPPSELYEPDTIGTTERNNLDTGYNAYGVRLLELCKEVPLRILNGRFVGDLFGSLTCFRPNGASCVDYGAVSPALFSAIRYFRVEPHMPTVSDHSPISLGLSANVSIVSCRTEYNFVDKPGKIYWDPKKKEDFCSVLMSTSNQGRLQAFLDVLTQTRHLLMLQQALSPPL